MVSSATAVTRPLVRVSPEPGSPSNRTGCANGAGLNRPHPKPGHRFLAGQGPADRRLVDDEADLDVGAGGQARIQLALDLLDRDPFAWLGSDHQGDVEAGLVLARLTSVT